MTQSQTTSSVNTSRTALLAASLAAPLAFVSNLAIGLLLFIFGVMKLLPDGFTHVPDVVSSAPASANLMRIATGGIIDTPWGGYLCGALQLALGLGLLIPSARAVAGLGCLLAAIAVATGVVWHWSELSTGNSINSTGIALISLFVLLLAGAASGTRSVARRLGAAT